MGVYVKKFWGSTQFGRPSGPYSPYIPDTLSNREFSFSEQTMLAISRASEAIIRLDSQGVTLTNTEPLARLLMRSEAVASSRIEGLSMSAKRLLEHEALVEIGVTPRPDSTEAAILANIQIMHEHVFSAHHGDPIDLALLKQINAELLADGLLKDHGGIVRTEQNWIGGSALDPVGASYIPPVPEEMPRLIDDLLRFCNTSGLPSVAKAALAHAQFESIHPFADGNGRTGRALTLLVLRSGGLMERTLPPISMSIASNRGTYIDALENLHCTEDDELRSAQEAFIRYFCSAVVDACGLARSFEERIECLRASWVERVRPRRGSAAERLLDVLPGTPVVSIQSAARLTGRSREAARNAIQTLVDNGVLVQNARNKKSNIFSADEVLDAFTLFERAAVTRGHDTANARPARAVPQKPKRSK
ncbi:Fic family protein [Collinsella stercoris]|uniref:Fic family protein n=1 Tax=Collinsella stercoris TaxID=147206 RepID=UPI003AEF2A4A